MTAVRVIGVGSPFGMDSIGWVVTERLESKYGVHSGREFVCVDRPGAGLLTLLEGCTQAFIIDAMRAGLPLGTVRRLTTDELEMDNPLLSSHGFGVAQALALGRSLGRMTEDVSVIGIEIGEGVAPFGSNEISKAVEVIANELPWN